MIEVKNLCLRLNGQLILEDINFVLEDGHNMIILGRSGAGKTVLIKTLMGFFPPDKGSVFVDGVDVYQDKDFHNSRLKHSFAMVFQNAALLDSFTVFQNVALSLYERGEMDLSEIRERVRKSLALVGLESAENKYPSELSGGMLKRVGIARALAYEPRYIIFDEPISGLDPITASEILYYITQIIEQGEVTTITITHDISNIHQLGDRVLFLEQGKQLYYGNLEGLYASQDPIIQKFLNLHNNKYNFNS